MKVLEVNVDDINNGGVYSLIKSVIENKPESLSIDIAAIEKFERPEHITYFKSLGTNVYWIGYEGNKLKKQKVIYHKLKDLILKNHYDVIHIHGDVANKLYVPAKAARDAGMTKIVLHSHAAGIDGNSRLLKLMVHKILRNKLKYLGSYFASCSDLASEWMFPNIPTSKIKMVHNGVNLNKFRFNPDTRDKERQALRIGDSLLIGHVGRFAYQKNHDYLIKIMKELKDRDANAKLLLIGQGSRMQEIQQMAQDDGVSENIIFYGPSSDIPGLMQAMDCFILPSHFEGLPIVGVEAQASGLPVIFSDQITKEAALLPTTKFLPITDSALSQWAIDILQARQSDRIKANDILRKEGFDISNTIQDFLSIYKEV